MQYRPLGTSDISVSLICLGTMTWGEQNSEAEGHRQIDMALDHGVNFLDTAEMYPIPAREETYGRTEQIIGSWLKKTGRRDDVVIATKVLGRSGFPYVRPDMDDGQCRLNAQQIRAAVDGSLKRLGTDVIDLYQLHWPERPANFFGRLRYKHKEDPDAIAIEETLEALADLVKEGKIRTIGFSNETAWGTMHALHLAEQKGLPRVQSVQNPYNLLNRSFEVAQAEVAMREKCGLLAYSPLAFGVLSGKYLDGHKPEGARLTLFGDKFPRYTSPRGVEATRRYVALAREHGLDPAQMANAFVNQQPFVTANIIGARTDDQLKAALETADMTLDRALLDRIDAIEDDLTFPCP
ncbi:NADP(H)-dependent aldo-keto reductase [Yunchengibacter salinarum]|uniref:NADP(H)-dependent aldo-keto reductase n=1 Tax=Yunchengibacter salinarum TaxID=3133399 RepID=UPI0035B61707